MQTLIIIGIITTTTAITIISNNNSKAKVLSSSCMYIYQCWLVLLAGSWKQDNHSLPVPIGWLLVGVELLSPPVSFQRCSRISPATWGPSKIPTPSTRFNFIASPQTVSKIASKPHRSTTSPLFSSIRCLVLSFFFPPRGKGETEADLKRHSNNCTADNILFHPLPNMCGNAHGWNISHIYVCLIACADDFHCAPEARHSVGVHKFLGVARISGGGF